MADRDDGVLRHFVSRAQQPRTLAAGSRVESGATSAPPVQVNIILDQGFGSVSDQIDDTRFRYMGTAAPISKYETMCGRRTQHGCMASTFDWSK
jgi:hypothetical protein